MKSTINGVTTTFVGAHYQIVNGTVTKYYFAGASRIAMRTGSTLTYLLGDHLGSTSLTTDDLGNFVSELRYKLWGETRYSSGTTATSYRYTGQREEVSFGLYFYNARWYDPALGRFAQADTIVPRGIQGLDRYGYTKNNPIRYTDPSGHTPCLNANYDDGPQCFTTKYLWAWGIKTTGSAEQDTHLALAAAFAGEALSNLGEDSNFSNVDELQGDPQSVFRKTHGKFTVAFGADIDGCETVGSTITCGTIHRPITTFIHEFGHVLENYLATKYSGRPASDLDSYEDAEGLMIDQKNGAWFRTTLGFMCDTYDCLEYPPSLG